MKLIDLHEKSTGFDYEHAATEISKLCKPFLKAINYDLSNSMYRGISENKSTSFGISSVRLTNRVPTDTPLDVHNEFNKFFVKEFSHPYRNGLFVTGEDSSADAYGVLHYIFPIGQFSFVWAKDIDDLYGAYIKELDAVNRFHSGVTEAMRQEALEATVSRMHNAYTDSDLIGGLKSGGEMMVWCDKYIKIEHKYELDLGRLEDMIKKK